jgi:hypothetical protein
MASRIHLRARVQDRILEALTAKGASTKAEVSAAVLAHPQMIRLGIHQSDVTVFAKDLAKRDHLQMTDETWTITESGRFLHRWSTLSRK